MKKQILMILPALLLTGCFTKTNNNTNSSEVDISKLKIVCPTGAPAFAFYDYANNANFETNSTPSNIVAMMSTAGNKDVVVIDTTSGIKAIKNGAPFKMLANITFGNFFIASTGNDDNETMDEGDTIVLFGQNQTPDLLFHYLYGNTYDAGIEYVTNVQDAAKCLISGKNAVTTSTVDYVFVAQPVLYNALQKNANAKMHVNVQDAYKEKSGGKSLIQASVFVKNTLEKEVIDAFASKLSGDINEAVKNPDVITNKLSGLSAEEATALYGVNPAIATTVLKDHNGLGLGYKKAKDNKDNIDSFISLFSLENTNEEIYY